MKAELLWLPVVGWKAVLARDIFVHRQTSATFRRLLQSATRSLKAGNSIMTFPGELPRLGVRLVRSLYESNVIGRYIPGIVISGVSAFE